MPKRWVVLDQDTDDILQQGVIKYTNKYGKATYREVIKDALLEYVGRKKWTKKQG